MRSVPSHAIGVTDARPPEEVERAPDGEIHPTLAEPFDQLEIGERHCTARVRAGEGGGLTEKAHELFVDTATQPLHVCRVNQELCTYGRELLQQRFAHERRRNCLPAIRRHLIAGAGLSTGEIDDELLLRNDLRERREPRLRE